MLDDVEQEVLRGASLVIAGCGPVGAQVAIALVQTGAEWLTLADTGRHATRQSGPLCDQLFDVNPFANVDVAQIDTRAVDELVSHADLIIDTLDAGSSDTMRARFLLHSTAKRHHTPVLTGLDTGDAGLAIVYDYRDNAQPVLDGAVSEPEISGPAQIDPLQLLNRMITSSQVLNRADQPLVTGCSDVTGGECATRLAHVIAGQLVFDMLFKRPLDRLTMVDPEIQRSATASIKAAGQKIIAMYALRRRLRDVRARTRPAGFSPLHDDIFRDLRPYMEERVYEAGSVVIRQGDPADDFFVLVEGRVQVEHEEHEELEDRDDFDYEPYTSYTVIAELGPGDFFGEMALLSDAPRNASVVVTDRCVALTLTRGAFNLYLDESQPAFQRLREIALARKYENNENYGF
ncbi:hypothetical protein BH23CHL1_BH23CHL1_24260 [soil metagenome]